MANKKLPGWYKTLDEGCFGQELQRVLTPSRAIQSPELLRGRAAHLTEIGRAWQSPGRQIFVYGYRGVGKTSLAQTAAFQRQSSDGTPILLSCSNRSSCFDIISDMLAQVLAPDPTISAATQEKSFGISAKGFTAQTTMAQSQRFEIKPSNINDCIRIVKHVVTSHSRTPCHRY